MSSVAFTNIQIGMFLILKITVSTKFLKLYPKNKKRYIVLLGDFNINLLNYNDHQAINNFLDSLASNSFILYILHPTRINNHSKTLLDNMFSNFISPEIISSNIITTKSDHLPQFSFVPNILPNPPTQKSNYYERDWSKFKQENWIINYFDKNWTDLLQIDQQNVNLSLDSFLNNINSILDVHAPLLALLFRIQFLLKTTFMTAKDPQVKERYHKEYKDYRNMLSTIFKQSKTNYYNHYFEANWNSIKTHGNAYLFLILKTFLLKHGFLQDFLPTKFKSKIVSHPFCFPLLNFKNLVPPFLWFPLLIYNIEISPTQNF